MKKIVTLLIALLVLSVSSVFGMRTPIVDEGEIREVVELYYPHLKDYYDRGLLQVGSLSEETLADGSMEYNIRYRFVRAWVEDIDEMERIVEKEYPVIYLMRESGLVKDVKVYRYVEKESGEILTGITFERTRPTKKFRSLPRFHRP